MISVYESDWKSLKKKFPNLKHLSIREMHLEDLEEFVGFAKDSQLQSTSLKFRYLANVTEFQMNLFSDLCKISTLEQIDLKIWSPQKLPAFELDQKFKVIDFFQNDHFEGESKLPSLPFGPGVLHFRFQKHFLRERPFTSEDLKILKEKFPNLKRLVFPYGSIVQVQPGEFEIEVQATSTKFDDLLKQFPSVILTF